MDGVYLHIRLMNCQAIEHICRRVVATEISVDHRRPRLDWTVSFSWFGHVQSVKLLCKADAFLIGLFWKTVHPFLTMIGIHEIRQLGSFTACLFGISGTQY